MALVGVLFYVFIFDFNPPPWQNQVVFILLKYVNSILCVVRAPPEELLTW